MGKYHIRLLELKRALSAVTQINSNLTKINAELLEKIQEQEKLISFKDEVIQDEFMNSIVFDTENDCEYLH